MSPCPCSSCGDELVTAAAALSMLISKGKSADELAVLAALFTVIGDNLALLALHRPPNGSCETRDVY